MVSETIHPKHMTCNIMICYLVRAYDKNIHFIADYHYFIIQEDVKYRKSINILEHSIEKYSVSVSDFLAIPIF